MAVAKHLFEHAATSAADLRTKLFYLAKIDSDGKIAVCGDGEAAIGSIYEGANTGDPSTVVTHGIAKVICGASITAGARVASDASGKLVAAAVNDFEVGTALTAGDANDIIPVLLLSGRRSA